MLHLPSVRSMAEIVVNYAGRDRHGGAPSIERGVSIRVDMFHSAKKSTQTYELNTQCQDRKIWKVVGNVLAVGPKF